MNWVLFIAMLFGLQIFCLAVSRKVSKNLKTEQDYFLASRSVSYFPLMMTLIATQVGGGLILGAAQEAYTYGWSVILYPLGQSLGFVLLALGIGRKMAESKASTIAELCEKAFGSRLLRQTASGLSIISLFMIFVAQIIASKKFMVSLGFDQNWIFLAFWFLVILYTVLGGLKAVIATDIVQAAYFIVVFVIALLIAEGGSFSELIESSSLIQFSRDPAPKMVGWLILPLLFMTIEQDMGQRCFAANSPKTVTWATFSAAIVTLAIGAIPVYFGVLAKTIDVAVPDQGSVFMSVIQAVTNPTITALIACGVLAAIISTADSLINAISSNLTQDFSWSFLPMKHGVKMARWMTLFISLAGISFSYYFDNIVNVLIQSYDLSVSCMLIPVLVALLKGKGSYLAAWMSFIAGAVAFFVFRFIDYAAPRELLCIAISALGYWVGSLIGNRSDKKIGLSGS